MTSDEQQRARWDAVRGQGFWRYVLSEGVVKFGLTSAVAMLLWNELRHVTPDGSYPVTSTVATWALIGVPWGVLMWWLNERQHRPATATAPTPQTGLDGTP